MKHTSPSTTCFVSNETEYIIYMHRLLFSLSLSDIATCIMSSSFGGDRDALAALNQDYIILPL